MTKSLSDFLVTAGRQTHAGIALTYAASLDNALREILELRMSHLDSKLRGKIFDGYGPLSSFNARIDVTYAFGLIEQDSYTILHKIRKIRNEFAHTVDGLNFDMDTVARLVDDLPTPSHEIATSRLHRYVAIANEQWAVMQTIIARLRETGGEE